MPIFSNRTLASMLRALPSPVRARCEADLLGRLTSDGYTALAAEWELFSLSQMARGGTLDLAPLAQPGVPDAIFTSAGHSPIVVEVTALNDQDLEERFADDALGMLFYRAIHRLTGRPVGALDVHAVWPLTDRGLPTPGLPPRSQLHQFMRRPEIRQFVQEVAAAPDQTRTLEHRVGDSVTTVVFRPGAQFSSGPVTGYSARGFNEHNRRRLLKKLWGKAKQLKSSNLQFPSVLILCDGDCRMLREQLQQSWSPESAVHAVFDFISGKPTLGLPGPNGPWIIQKGSPQQSTTINAVLILTVEDKSGHFGGERSRNLKIALVRNEGAARHPLSDGALKALVDALATNVPKIHRTPMNAKKEKSWTDHEGGGQLSGTRVKLSMLAFQDLLTGHTSQAEFAARNEFTAEHIARLVNRGHCLSSARIIKDGESDDDWIEFDFADTDPRGLRRLVE
jgi:hypothetical protein